MLAANQSVIYMSCGFEICVNNRSGYSLDRVYEGAFLRVVGSKLLSSLSTIISRYRKFNLLILVPWTRFQLSITFVLFFLDFQYIFHLISEIAHCPRTFIKCRSIVGHFVILRTRNNVDWHKHWNRGASADVHTLNMEQEALSGDR